MATKHKAAATLVTITATAPITVVVESIKDEGRERHENGTTPLAADEEHSFIVHGTQSIRVVETPKDAQ